MARPVLGFALGTLLVALGALGLASDAPGDRAATRWLGDPAADQALDEHGILHVGEVMTVDALADGEIVSYEYIHDDLLYVGYQRAPAALPLEVKPFDLVELDLLADQPGRSRLRGTRLQPRAQAVAIYRATRPVRRGLAGLLMAGGLLLVILAARARAR